MARANRRRLFRLPRRADQQPGAERVSIPRPRSLASAAMPAQPKSKNAMDAHDETGRRVPPPAASPASLAECALRRQTPEVGAECPNWARSELSGGRSETGVPTGNRFGPRRRLGVSKKGYEISFLRANSLRILTGNFLAAYRELN